MDISQEILFKASEGDLQAFESVYKLTAGFVYNVAFRIVNNREDAQEVAQEVFLIIYHKLKDFRFESSFKTWAYRITVNCAINRYKSASRIKSRTTSYDEASQEGKDPEVHEIIKEQQQSQMVNELLSQINPDQRACMILRNIEGLSYEEIAKVLRININTVRSRLKRAREKLLSLRKKVSL